MSETDKRATAREIARRHLDAGDPLGWFEELYVRAGQGTASVPWADMKPNPNVTEWLDRHPGAAVGRALEIGCGLGDNAEELARRGFETTAFDISESAVAWCRRRFPGSPVSYEVADLFAAPAPWRGRFDLVVESYTLQVLPPGLRAEAVRAIASFVAPGGTLLAVARGREPADPEGSMPWPLTRAEIYLFRNWGLAETGFEDYLDSEDPPVRRFRASFRRAEKAVNEEPSMTVRTETKGDVEAILAVTKRAFENHPYSRNTEPFIVNALREAGALVISLVAEIDGRVVGHAGFSPVTLDNGPAGWYGLGPISVLPEFQKQGIGRALMNEGLSRLRALDARGCVLVGDPGFYARFGFKSYPELTHAGVPQPFVLALPFAGGEVRGEAVFHPGFRAES